MKKVTLHPEAYEIITIGGACVFSIFTSIGLGLLYVGLCGTFTDQTPYVGWGIGLVTLPFGAWLWWGILNLFFSSDPSARR